MKRLLVIIIACSQPCHWLVLPRSSQRNKQKERRIQYSTPPRRPVPLLTCKELAAGK